MQRATRFEGLLSRQTSVRGKPAAEIVRASALRGGVASAVELGHLMGAVNGSTGATGARVADFHQSIAGLVIIS